MRRILLVLGGIMLIGATTSDGSQRTPETQAKLDSWLAGRVAGKPMRCIAPDKTRSPIGIDDGTLLFRDGPRIWRNDLQAGQGCSDLSGLRTLGREGNRLRVCRGERLLVVDMPTGSTVGACILGDFVPYERAK
ncbi:hypothetical protein [Sphingomonas daechungensis]|uniref:hypothetical protein n=1 Tax=Sphingomonas daechungensis TaxID=1176646 RepID=UPI0037840F0B